MSNICVREIFSGSLLVAQIYDLDQSDDVIFPTPPTAEFQCGFGVVKERKSFKPHIHNKLQRATSNTSEFIMVLKGELNVLFLDEAGAELGHASLKDHQAFLQFVGGHMIEIAEGTRYVELKQGPYMGHSLDKMVLD